MLNNLDKNYIWLDSFGLNLKKRTALIDLAHGIDKIFDIFSDSNKAAAAKIVTSAMLTKMKSAATDEYLLNHLKKLNKFQIACLTQANSNYPARLRDIPDAPHVLYLIGDVSLLDKPSIGIVGTRRPSRYGRDVADSFAKKLIDSLVPVSGLAFGIDSCVAQAGVDVKKPTIAVMGCGLDYIYPPSNTNLARQIVEFGGLLVSEYPPEIRPTQYSFLERNRIISGLSLGVLVVEAGVRSGATATAYDAVEQGRELFVIPGNITSETSAGCNKLIENMPDTFTTSVDQILTKLKIDARARDNGAQPAIQLTVDEMAIITAIGDEEMYIDDIGDATGIFGKTLVTTLAQMEIKGIIKKLSGNYYAKISLPN